MEETVVNVQLGFREGLGTMNATFILRTLIEMTIANQKDLYMCSVNYVRAFNTVRFDQMMEKLTTLGVDQADLRPLTSLCWNQRAVVRVEADRAVCQGCIMSPDILSLYSQSIITQREKKE